MLCYFISKKDFSLLNCVEVNSYSVGHDLNLGGKSRIVIACNPKAAADDFVVLKDGKDIKLKGIIEKIDNIQGENMHTISCLEIERIFDRKIFLTDTEIIKATGIEDFIAATIRKHFSQTGDSFVDMAYINCRALTHTKVNSKPDAEDGIYNFKTYIGNIKEKYGIFLEFEFTKTALNITIHKKEQTPLNIDTTLTDIDSCKETYEIKALSKLSVKWLNLSTNEETLRNFYLHTDRTISEVDEKRVEGTIAAFYSATDTEEEMIEAVTNEFRSNSYSHLIEANIYANSKLYPLSELYVGHEVTIKTAAGVKESIISGISFSDNADLVLVKFGNLKVTLTDKLK